MMLAGDSGSLERPSHFKFEWVGTESELVRLSKRIGILRSANPLPVLTGAMVKKHLVMSHMRAGNPATVDQARALLRKIGMTLTKHDGEYRVAFRGRGQEASAYYTNDIMDAMATGLDMAKRKGIV